MKIYTTLFLIFTISLSFTQENKVAFTENKGQIIDQNHKQREDVVATLKSKKGLFVVRKNGFSFQETKENSGNSILVAQAAHDFTFKKEEASYLINRLDINWVNCEQNPQIKFIKALKTSLNFYNSQEGQAPILDVLSYEEIVLNNIYVGIDVRFYLKNGELEYDYIVHENATIQDLKIEVQGGKFSLMENGDLNINSVLGNILESAPKVFQEGKEIKSSWKMSGNQIAGFNIAKSKRRAAIIIDPVIREWATYVGGEGGEAEIHQDIECDFDGNVYIVGSTSSTSNIVTSGVFSTVLQGTSDAFVSKFDRDGYLLWSTYYGGEMTDGFNKIAVNSSHNIVCMGNTSSTQNIATNTVFQSVLNGSSNAFLVSFNANGQRVWGTYYDGLNYPVYGCDIDNLGNICLSSCVSVPGLSSLGAYQEDYNGNTDYLLAKLDNTGNRIWATYYGGSEMESFRGASSFFDYNGNIFLIGGTNSSTDIVSLNAYQVEYNGSEDGIIVKFDSNGNRLWATYFGGNGGDYIYNGFVDEYGNSYIVGETTSDSLLVPSFAYQNQWAGNNTFDGFLGKFNPSGEFLWATYYGDSLHEEIHSIDTDAKGNVWIAGYTNSENMATDDGFMTERADTNGAADLFLVKFDSLGNRHWASYYGGLDSEHLGQVCAGRDGDVFLSGKTSANENISSTGSYHETLSGISDYFLVKFNDKEWNLNSEEISLNKHIMLYPNPVKDFLHFKSSNQHVIKGIQIFDYTGKLIQEMKKTPNGKINVENLISGIYLLQIDFENSSIVEKFIKE